MTELTINKHEFTRAISSIKHSLTKNKTDFLYNRVQLLTEDDCLILATTDRHRMTVSKLSYCLKSKGDEYFEYEKLLYANELFDAAKNLNGDCITININENNIVVKDANSVRELNYELLFFPLNYRELLSRANCKPESRVTLDRKPTLELFEKLVKITPLEQGIMVNVRKKSLLIEYLENNEHQSVMIPTKSLNHSRKKFCMNPRFIKNALESIPARSEYFMDIDSSFNKMVIIRDLEFTNLSFIMPIYADNLDCYLKKEA